MSRKHARGIYLGSTDVPAQKTIGEIFAALIKHNARRIGQKVEGDKCVGIEFTLLSGGLELAYELPAHTAKIFAKLQNTREPRLRNGKAREDLQQAERIAWRQLLHMVQVQLALVEDGMKTTDAAFLEYMVLKDGRTMYQRFLDDKQKMLAAGAGKGGVS